MSISTANELIDTRGVYLILKAQAGTCNRERAFKRERRIFSYSNFQLNPPVGNRVTMELHWRLHGQPMQQNHSHL